MKTVPKLTKEIITVIGNYVTAESEGEKVVEINEISSILRMLANDYSIAEERSRVREYLKHYKTKSDCCSQTVDDIYTTLSSLDTLTDK